MKNETGREGEVGERVRRGGWCIGWCRSYCVLLTQPVRIGPRALALDWSLCTMTVADYDLVTIVCSPHTHVL